MPKSGGKGRRPAGTPDQLPIRRWTRRRQREAASGPCALERQPSPATDSQRSDVTAWVGSYPEGGGAGRGGGARKGGERARAAPVPFLFAAPVGQSTRISCAAWTCVVFGAGV